MPKVTREFSRYVNARWLPFLVENVLRPTAKLSALTLDATPANARPFDYRGVLRIPALAQLVAEHDRGGENESSWAKTIGRWVYDQRAPEPETIRRVLGALGFDWVIGLGLSGYKQQAIVLLHILYSRMGGRSRVAAQARAIFDGSDYERSKHGWRSRRTFTVTAERARGADVPHIARLDRAAGCWKGGDVPTRCTAPADLFASEELCAAWMLLDSALISRIGNFERRMRAVDEIVAREVWAWADGVTRTNHSPRFQEQHRRPEGS